MVYFLSLLLMFSGGDCGRPAEGTNMQDVPQSVISDAYTFAIEYRKQILSVIEAPSQSWVYLTPKAVTARGPSATRRPYPMTADIPTISSPADLFQVMQC